MSGRKGGLSVPPRGWLARKAGLAKGLQLLSVEYNTPAQTVMELSLL